MAPHLTAILGGALSLALIGLAGGLQLVRDAAFPVPPAVSEERLTVTSGAFLKRLTTGYHMLAADLYWIRAIQHYGSTKLRLASALPPGRTVAETPGSTTGRSASGPGGPGDEPYGLLAPLLDLTTTLDPYFNIAYRFGAIFLAEPRPGGAGRPDLAIALLEKGLKARADKWEYMQDIGFVHYWWRQDPKTAADWFDRASRLPGAPWWLRSLAANVLTQGGDRRTSRLMWENIRESAEIDWLRRDADRRLLQLQALDDLDALQRLLDSVAARGLVVGPTWDPLVERKMLPAVPADPTGTPYEIAADGRVRLSSQSALFPLPTEPHRLAPTS